MPIEVQWGLAIITVISAGFGMWEWYRRWKWGIEDAVREEKRREQLAGILLSLQAIRSGCVEASDTERVIRTPAEKQFVANIGFALKGLENQVSLMLGDFVLMQNDKKND